MHDREQHEQLEFLSEPVRSPPLSRLLSRRPPKNPGVYLMGDATNKVIYVGQSKNLRQRLQSYREPAKGQRNKKLSRLLSEVRSVTWEI